MNMKILNDLLAGKSTMDKLFNMIKGQRDSLEYLIQVAGTMMIYYAVKDGNISTLNQYKSALLDAAGKLVRSAAVLEWLEVHGPVTYDPASEAFVLDKAKRKIKQDYLKSVGIPKFLGDLMSKPIAEVRKENKYAGFDIITSLERVVKRARQALAKHPNDPSTNVTQDDVSDVLSVIQKLKAGESDKTPPQEKPPKNVKPVKAEKPPKNVKAA